MSSSPHDPKGYYRTLGVEPGADAAAIKAAFRSRAKEVHPDTSDLPDAAAQFQALQEAYDVLSDVLRRRAYDAKAKPDEPPKTSSTRANGAQKERPKDNPKDQTKAEAPKREKPKQEAPKSAKANTEKPKQANRGLQPLACRCGKISAQPREVEFDMVRGRGTRVDRKTVADVFCRTCADQAGLRASLTSWLAGWWAVPDGPTATIDAIWSNMRGGRKPRAKNADILLHQARAFRDRGDTVVAKSIAKQGLAFADPGSTRSALTQLIDSLAGVPDKPLKNPWNRPGWMPMLHLAPLGGLIIALSLTLSYQSPAPISGAIKAVTETFSDGDQLAADIALNAPFTTARRTMLRTGPGPSYAALVMLTPGVRVTTKERAEDGRWVRVETAAGENGFLAVEDLRAVAPE